LETSSGTVPRHWKEGAVLSKGGTTMWFNAVDEARQFGYSKSWESLVTW